LELYQLYQLFIVCITSKRCQSSELLRAALTNVATRRDILIN